MSILDIDLDLDMIDVDLNLGLITIDLELGIPIIGTGTAGEDVTAGSRGVDLIETFGGDDRIIGSDGLDLIGGGAGFDTLIFDFSSDRHTDPGIPRDVTITNGTVRTNDGGLALFDDVQTGMSGIERVVLRFGERVGGEIVDTNDDSANASTFSGSGGVQFISGGGNDNFIGSLSGDRFAFLIGAGTGTNATVDGGAGDDASIIQIDGSSDATLTYTENGGTRTVTTSDGEQIVMSSVETVAFTFRDGAAGGAGRTTTIDAAAATGSILGDFSDQQGTINISTGSGQDALQTGSGDDTVRAGAGDDTIDGGAGDDRLFGEAGDDVINGGAGNDRLLGGIGNDIINGNGGADALLGGTGADRMAGGVGDDRYNVDNANDIVIEAAGEGTDAVLARIDYTLGDNVENLRLLTGDWNGTGNELDNVIFGSSGANTLSGLAGQDRLVGNDGQDTLNGGDGDDRLLGGNDNDVLNGGAGIDNLIGGAGIDQMSGGTGDDRYFLDTADDVVIEAAGEGIDAVFAGFDYTLGDNVEQLRLLAGTWNGTGNALDNTIFGSAGANTILGLDGDDRLFGNGGPDILDGGAGNDRLFGGIGRDTMTGGEGADIFIFQGAEDLRGSISSVDVIRDFNSAEGDRIWLYEVDAIAGGADDAFEFIGTDAFSGTAGELRYFQQGSNTFVEMDTDGDGVGDLFLSLEGSVDLTMNDFVL